MSEVLRTSTPKRRAQAYAASGEASATATSYACEIRWIERACTCPILPHPKTPIRTIFYPFEAVSSANGNDFILEHGSSPVPHISVKVSGNV